MTRPGQQPRDHEQFEELAVGWALHALEPEDEDVFATHLPTCPRCAVTVADTHEVMAALAGDLPGSEPSPGLRDRLRAAVEETEQLPRTAPAAPPTELAAAPERLRPRPVAVGGSSVGDLRSPGAGRRLRRGGSGPMGTSWRRVLPAGLVAAGVAAVLALGTWNVVIADDRDSAQATATTEHQLLDQLLQPGTATVAPLESKGRNVGTVVAHADHVQVVTAGLEVNDSRETTYVVWGMENLTTPVPLGTFDVVSSELDVRTVGSTATGLDGYSGYAVSREPGRSAPAAPTDIVASGRVDS